MIARTKALARSISLTLAACASAFAGLPVAAQTGAQYPASQYPSGQYPSGQYPAAQYPAGQYPVQPTGGQQIDGDLNRSAQPASGAANDPTANPRYATYAAGGNNAYGQGTPQPAPRSPTYHQDDLIGAAEGVFGKGAHGLAGVIHDILRKQGEPNGYIVGREGGGLSHVGARPLPLRRRQGSLTDATATSRGRLAVLAAEARRICRSDAQQRASGRTFANARKRRVSDRPYARDYIYDAV